MIRLRPFSFVPTALLAISAAASLSACTSAGLCTRGEEGCACREDDDAPCDTGSTCDDEGMCVKDGTSPEPDSGTDDDAGTGDGGSDDGRPDAGPPAECMGDNLMGACTEFCEAFCQNQERLCVESTCEPGDCEAGGTLLDVCLDSCDTPRCARTLCETERDRTCEKFGFSSTLASGVEIYESGCFMSDPRCVLNPAYGCSDTCGELPNGTGGELAGNGVCEDGGEDAADSLCPWTTDCSDCGERDCAEAGDNCDKHGDCCGFLNDAAFCVETGSGAECLQTCDEDNPDCPEDYDCVAIEGEGGFVCAPL